MDSGLSFQFSEEFPNNQRLDVFLANQTGKSRTFIKLQIESSRVFINGEVVTKASHLLKHGDAITAHFVEEEALSLKPIEAPLAILFEDEHLLVLNKAQGVVVHPAPGHRGETLVHHLLYHLKNKSEFTSLSATRPGIVHRLDRGTSGVLLVGKTRATQEALAAQFKSREVKKVYETIVWGKTKLEGTIQSTIGRDTRDRKKMSSRAPNGREAKTRWKCAEAYNHFSHLMLYPHTGRTHQLRVHLSESGHPVVGDELYGRGMTKKRRALLDPAIVSFLEGISQTFLHAKELTFHHPISKETLTVTAPAPEIFGKFLDLLKTYDK